MPHASIRILKGKNPAEKKKLVKDVSLAVASGLGHPEQGGMIEYELVDIPAGNLAKGGKLNAGGPPPAYIIVNILKGRTREQKKKVAEYVSAAVAKHLGIPSDSEGIIVEIAETSTKNISHGGKLTLDNPPPVII
jgi:4-oxalocrotonate tautomerase family enzyme